MDHRYLRTFVTVAEQLHFRRAAERLYLSQPTVTAHIQALERELGAPLLVRSGRRVTLTPAGERLLPLARQMLALEAEARAAIVAWRHRYSERLRIIASIFVAASALPGALRRLLDERPRLEVSLRTAFSRDVAPAVAEGTADLGLSRLPPASPGVRGSELLREPVVAVAPAQWGATALPEALAHHPLWTHNHPGYWDRLLANLAALGLTFWPMEVGQVDVTRRLIAAGLGLSFLPESAIAEDRAPRGPLQVLPAPTGLELPSVGTWAIWSAERSLPGAGQRLIQLLQG